jgi:hypothetical protein
MEAVAIKCFPPSMSAQRFFRRPLSAAAPPPPPDQTRIPINWDKTAIKITKIRHLPVEMPAQARSIYLKPKRSQKYAAQLELDAPGIFTSPTGGRAA